MEELRALEEKLEKSKAAAKAQQATLKKLTARGA